MAHFHMDANTGSDANDGSTWALAKLTFEGLVGLMSAGDFGYVRANASSVFDTAAATRTFTFPTGTTNSSSFIRGVKTGTTNEGANIVGSDLVVRGTDTLPVIECTGANSDLSFNAGATVHYYGIDFRCSDQILSNSQGAYHTWQGCRLQFTDRIRSQAGIHDYYDCELAFNAGGAQFSMQNPCYIRGGEFTFNGTVGDIFDTNPFSNRGNYVIEGVDMSTWATGQNLVDLQASSCQGEAVFRNCAMPASFDLMSAVVSFATPMGSITAINMSTATSIGDTSSFQNYERVDRYGTIVEETTAVRTGGADDDAAGGFAYAMTPFSDAVIESSHSSVKSPWMEIWVEAGSQTLTVFIANDTASTDYNEDEARAEFYFPNNNDTSQWDMTLDPDLPYLLGSSTAITDDTGSSWGTGANNHQKFTAAINPGYEGPAYARVILSKRQTTPDTMYVDPALDVA